MAALTLPGLESAEADRSAITMRDHVEAICEAIGAAGDPVVLAVHSGAGASGYAASDRVPELIAAMVYVDSGPAKGALEPDFEGVEMPMPALDELAKEENLDGLTAEHLETFRRRAVPEPGAVLREAAELTDDAASTSPASSCAPGSRPSRSRPRSRMATPGSAASASMRDVTWVDLPTSHWPMWSRPRELAVIIGDVAKAHASAG